MLVPAAYFQYWKCFTLPVVELNAQRCGLLWIETLPGCPVSWRLESGWRVSATHARPTPTPRANPVRCHRLSIFQVKYGVVPAIVILGLTAELAVTNHGMCSPWSCSCSLSSGPVCRCIILHFWYHIQMQLVCYITHTVQTARR